ncbi:hypothetical protein T484DRAFT_1905959, partial [Baffinella frigidus]
EKGPPVPGVSCRRRSAPRVFSLPAVAWLSIVIIASTPPTISPSSALLSSSDLRALSDLAPAHDSVRLAVLVAARTRCSRLRGGPVRGEHSGAGCAGVQGSLGGPAIKAGTGGGQEDRPQLAVSAVECAALARVLQEDEAAVCREAAAEVLAEALEHAPLYKAPGALVHAAKALLNRTRLVPLPGVPHAAHGTFTELLRRKPGAGGGGGAG